MFSMGLSGCRPGVPLVNALKHPIVRQQAGFLAFFFFFLLMQISQLEFLSIPFLATIEASETLFVSFLVTLCSMGACDWLEREFNNSGFTHYLEITPHFRIMSASVFCRNWVWRRRQKDVESPKCVACKHGDLSSESQHACKSWVQ